MWSTIGYTVNYYRRPGSASAALEITLIQPIGDAIVDDSGYASAGDAVRLQGLDAVDVVDVEHVHENEGMAAWAEAGVLQEGPAVLLEFGQQLPVVVVARRQMDRLAGDHIEDRVLGQRRVPIDLARVVRQQQVLAVGRQREGLRRQRLLRGGKLGKT